MTGLYERVAAGFPELEFLNYGFADAAGCAWIRPHDLRHKYHLSLIRHLLAGIDLSGKTVLEIGSGRGGNCRYLAQYTGARTILGLDLCEANARLSDARRHSDRIRFLCGDAQRVPVADAAIDVVVNLESSHCYPDFEAFLSEVFRVLRPGGHFAYADIWDFARLPLDWASRRKALDNAPFDVLSEEDISEQVFRALKSEAGFSHVLLALENSVNSALAGEIVRSNEGIRLSLAAALCSYRLWRLRKPAA